MLRQHKNTVKFIIGKKGCWTGFLASLEELENVIAKYAYYNCNSELGNRVEEELANINTKPIDLMAFHHFVKNIDEILHNVSGEEKKELLRMIVEQIEITPSAEKRSHSRQKGRESNSH